MNTQKCQTCLEFKTDCICVLKEKIESLIDDLTIKNCKCDFYGNNCSCVWITHEEQCECEDGLEDGFGKYICDSCRHVCNCWACENGVSLNKARTRGGFVLNELVQFIENIICPNCDPYAWLCNEEQNGPIDKNSVEGKKYTQMINLMKSLFDRFATIVTDNDAENIIVKIVNDLISQIYAFISKINQENEYDVVTKMDFVIDRFQISIDEISTFPEK